MAYTYIPLATTTVGSGGTTNISFTSISGAYTDLKIAVSSRSTRSATNAELLIKFNNSTNDFSVVRLYGSGGTGAVGSSTTGTGLVGVTAAAQNDIPYEFGNMFIYIPNYAENTVKTFWSESGYSDNTTTTNIYNYYIQGTWNQTAAITQIDLYPEGGTSWVQYTTATLYGILKA
jgi:hypothetical protein